jgi:hypothetical protein
MIPLDFGTLISEIKTDNYSVYILQTENNLLVKITKYESHNEVEFFREGKSIVKFIDKIISENSLERQIGTKKYLFVNKVQQLFTQKLKTKYISKLAPSISVGKKQICMDIETYMDGDTLVPFLICFYDGEKAFYFGL